MKVTITVPGRFHAFNLAYGLLQNNNLDKIFDEKLNAYSSHVSENIWSNIHMNLPQHSANRNKRWIFLLLLFIGVSIAGSLIYYYKQFQLQ